jgi:DNA polymerase-1
VRTRKDAKKVIKILKMLKNRIHAWDTETMNIEVK